MNPDPAQMEAALRLIGGDCESFTRGLCSDEGQGRSPYAKYTAGRWCDPCIARAGLAGTLPHVPQDPAPGVVADPDRPKPPPDTSWVKTTESGS